MRRIATLTAFTLCFRTTLAFAQEAPPPVPPPGYEQQPEYNPPPVYNAPPVYNPPPVYYPPPTYVPPPVAAPVYQQQLAPPLSSHVEYRPRYGLMIPGLSIFGVTYLLNLLVAYGGEGRMAIPVIGPLLQVDHHRDEHCSDYCREHMMGDFMGLMVFDTLVQSTGVVLFLVGALWKRPITVYDRVAIVPTAGAGGAGLAAVGHF